MIVIAVAIFVSVGLFMNSASAANRDAMMDDLMKLAARAQVFYMKPGVLGGGGRSFSQITADVHGMQRLVNTVNYPYSNMNGTYQIAGAGNDSRVILSGVGREIGQDAVNPVVITLEVFPDSVRILDGGVTVAN
jgi:hypothetical protein